MCLIQLHQRWQQHVEEVHHGLVEEEQQQHEDIHAALEILQDDVNIHQQAVESLRRDLMGHLQDAVKYRQDVARLVEQRLQEMKAVFEQAVAEQHQ